MAKGKGVVAGTGIGVAAGVGVCAVVGVDWKTVGPGNVAEWVAGIGALVAAGVALWVSHRAEIAAETAADEARTTAAVAAAEARQAASRDRVIGLLVRLIAAVEHDAQRAYDLRPELIIDPAVFRFSAEGSTLCRALWGHRNLFGTTWHAYCEDDRPWIRDLSITGELWSRMRDELQRAIDQLDHEDRAAGGTL